MLFRSGVCDEVAAELSKHGECFSLPADLGTIEGLDHLGTRLAEREGSLHILVNNAGATWGAPLEEYPDEAFDKIWAVNVKAIFHLTVKCLPVLRKAATATFSKFRGTRPRLSTAANGTHRCRAA